MSWRDNFKLAYGIESPCRVCGERSAACWDTCETYKAYKAKIDEIKGRFRDVRDEEYRLHPGIKRSKGNWGKR